MSDLKTLTGLVYALEEANAKVSELEIQLERAKRVQNSLSEHDIPDMLDELGMTEVVINGKRISVKSDLRTSLSKARKDEAMQWLDDHGHSAILKRSVRAMFNKGQEQEAMEFLQAASGKFDVAMERDVHSSTLKKLLKDALANGEEVPLELFGAFEQRKTILKGLN